MALSGALLKLAAAQILAKQRKKEFLAKKKERRTMFASHLLSVESCNTVVV